MTTQELKNQIARYVFGDVMLDAFQAWFIPAGYAGADRGQLPGFEVTLGLVSTPGPPRKIRLRSEGALRLGVGASGSRDICSDESQHVAVITGTSSEGTETQFSLALQTTAWAGTGLSKVPA